MNTYTYTYTYIHTYVAHTRHHRALTNLVHTFVRICACVCICTYMCVHTYRDTQVYMFASKCDIFGEWETTRETYLGAQIRRTPCTRLYMEYDILEKDPREEEMLNSTVTMTDRLVEWDQQTTIKIQVVVIICM